MGLHSDQYRVGDTVYSIPMPLLRKVCSIAENADSEEVADNADSEEVADNAWEAYTMGILSGTGTWEYKHGK